METDALLDGVVTSWDDPRGLGEITAADGRTFALQCTDLADGSRTIEAGVAVTFGVRPGHRGRWQAVAVTRR